MCQGKTHDAARFLPPRNIARTADQSHEYSDRLRSSIGYKAGQAGIPVVLVAPRNTSRRCPACGSIDKANRPNQSTFRCVVWLRWSCQHSRCQEHSCARQGCRHAAGTRLRVTSRRRYSRRARDKPTRFSRGFMTYYSGIRCYFPARSRSQPRASGETLGQRLWLILRENIIHRWNRDGKPARVH